MLHGTAALALTLTMAVNGVPTYGPVAAPTIDPGPAPAELRPEPPPYDGRGLLIGAGVLGLANIGLVAARVGLSLGEPTAAQEYRRFILTAVATPIDVVAGIGLAAGGGYLRGRQDGYRSAFTGAPKLRAIAFSSSGVVLLVMGAVGWASAWTPWHGDESLDGRGRGSLVVESVGSLLLMAGSGLVAYGASWAKHTRRYSRSRPLGVHPKVGPGFVGLTLGGHF